MPLLDDWELDDIAADLAATLDDLCDIYRRTATMTDEYGGGISSLDAVHEDVAVGVVVDDVLPYADNTVAMRPSDVTRFQLAFPRGTDVRAGDEVHVASMDVVLRVVTALGPESDDVMVKAKAVLVQ